MTVFTCGEAMEKDFANMFWVDANAIVLNLDSYRLGIEKIASNIDAAGDARTLVAGPLSILDEV